MKKFLLVVVVLLIGGPVFSSANNPDSTLNLLDKGVIANKLILVKDKMNVKDYRGAIQLCREILVDDKNNATTHYRMAECYYEIYDYKDALESHSKAIASNPKVSKDSDYLLAKIQHKLGVLDKALENLLKYKAKLNEKEIKTEEVDLNEQQIRTALEIMKKPVGVKIAEMGENVNSHQDDYSPILSADGKTLFLCSRRPNSTGSEVNVDFKYFEDIYVCVRDESGNWQQAEVLDGKINTIGMDNCSYLSKDGTVMYLTYNLSAVDGFNKSSDIAIAKLSKSGKWNMGKLIKKLNNKTYFDACATLNAEMDQIVFISDRPGGAATGTSDLWKCGMKGGNPTGAPITIPSLNTIYNETTPHMTADGKYLFFSSEGHGSMGGYDIFVSKFVEGNWSTPVNLGYPINSVDDDTHFSLSPDGKKAYFSSIRKDGTGGRDIYEVDLGSFDLFGLIK